MARIITCNTNGIRAAARKGFFHWLQTQAADVVCIQETKAQVDQLTDPLFFPEGYHCTYNDAEKKGYSGTAIYSRVKPRKVITRLGWDPADSEGRYIQADFDGLSVISVLRKSITNCATGSFHVSVTGVNHSQSFTLKMAVSKLFQMKDFP